MELFRSTNTSRPRGWVASVVLVTIVTSESLVAAQTTERMLSSETTQGTSAAQATQIPSSVQATPSAQSKASTQTTAGAPTTPSAPTTASAQATASAQITLIAQAPQGDPQLAFENTNPKRCGLGAAFHAGRRQKLVEGLRAQSENGGVVLVRGLPAPRDYTRFQQDKTFWYLTGVESPNATLVIDVKSGASTLFLPARSTANERWDGEIWDAEDVWVREVTGFTDVRPAHELVATLKEMTSASKLVWISKEPWVALSGCADRALPYDRSIEKDPLDGRASRESVLEENLREKLKVEVKDCAPTLAEMRRIKTTEEIGALRRASRVGALAMTEAVRSSRPGIGEWQLEALMGFVHRREGATGPAYYGIVGCGPNALVLHYSEDVRVLGAGEMLLLDYAPEFDHYVSDITRSWPVDGHFTPRMIEIYDAVLEAQQAGIAEIKPGKSFEDIEKACRRVLAKRGMMKLLRHGVSHFVGMEVHDVGDYKRPLEPGVVLTVEPGVYDTEAGIGVRIEDVVLVTVDGCEVLSALAPKDRATLSQLVAEEGLLDRLIVPPPLSRPNGRVQATEDH